MLVNHVADPSVPKEEGRKKEGARNSLRVQEVSVREGTSKLSTFNF